MNTTAHWFKAAELTGECVDIRFGRISPSSVQPEWQSISHCECDGLGGFAQLLRENGADDIKLPETHFSNKKFLTPFFTFFKRYQAETEIALRDDWNLSPQEDSKTLEAQTDPPKRPSKPISWHLFSDDETKRIRDYCRRESITVNSHLLKLLDQSVRPDTKRPELAIPWLIPVNTRGDVSYKLDTENHVSCIEPIITAEGSTKDLQTQISQRLNLGEHRRNQLILALTTFLPLKLKAHILTKSRNKSKGNIGAFSNLGVWDSENTINTTDSWLFCPPITKDQLVAAGAVTFQNKLGLAIQTHSHLPEYPEKWMQSWQNSLMHTI